MARGDLPQLADRLDWLVNVTAWSAYATRQADARLAALEKENADLRRTLARGGSAGVRIVDPPVDPAGLAASVVGTPYRREEARC